MPFLLETLYKRAPSAGLVIRRTEVELLSLQGRRVTNRVRVPIEGKEDAQLVAAIQRALAAATLKPGKLAVALSTPDILFRFFTMPLIPKAEWEGAVQFEARKYIPFKPDTVVWDWQASPSATANRLDVIFTAIQRETFERLQANLTAAGVQPALIEPRSVSLARVVRSPRGSTDAPFVSLVELERDCAHLAIVKDGLPYLTRDIMLVSGGPSGASQQAPDGSPPVQGGLTDHHAQRLLSELSVSRDFFMREYPTARLPQVVFFGEETLIGPWCRWFAEQLRCPVELGNAFLEPYADDVPLSFAAAVGLLQATKDVRRATFDFLKRSVVKTPSVSPAKVLSSPRGITERLWTPQISAVAGVAVALLLAIWAMGAWRVQTAHHALHQLIRSRPDVGWGLNQMDQEGLQSVRAKAASQVDMLVRIIDQRMSAAETLDALVRSLPEGVWLTGVTYEDQLDILGKDQAQLLVNGACFLGEMGQELSAIQQFEEQVRRNPKLFSGFGVARLDHIDAQVSPKQQYTYRTFQLQCQTERKL